MPIITLKFKDKKILDYPIAVGQSCTIGRKKSNDIVIDNLAVSGAHAKIEGVSTTFVVRDLDPTNGTFVNQKKITLHNLKHKDVVLIGKHELLFDRSDLIRQAKQADWSDDDKTRILNTNDFKKILDKEEEPSPGRRSRHNRSEDSASLLQRIWKWIVG
jgi:pSer/pThr/pTyr-binding forkhead associated (FHA) protein